MYRNSEVGECSGNDVPTKETEQNVEVSNTIGESNAIAITTLPETEGSDVLGDGNIASEIVNIPGGRPKQFSWLSFLINWPPGNK